MRYKHQGYYYYIGRRVRDLSPPQPREPHARTMSKKKTSFKELLSKGASNPRINVQSVRDQRQKLDTLKRSGQPAAASAPPAKRAASSSAAPALIAPKTSAAAGGHAAFVYAPTFAGLRPGYAFKTGPQGVGYYHEGGATAAEPAEEEVAMPFSQPPQHSLGQRSFAAIAAEEEAEAEAEAEEAAAGAVLPEPESNPTLTLTLTLTLTRRGDSQGLFRQPADGPPQQGQIRKDQG